MKKIFLSVIWGMLISVPGLIITIHNFENIYLLWPVATGIIGWVICYTIQTRWKNLAKTLMILILGGVGTFIVWSVFTK